MLKIYLDTNIYIHGLIAPDTNSALLLKEIMKGKVVVIQSDYLIKEILSWYKN